jgi:hypothetical protein
LQEIFQEKLSPKNCAGDARLRAKTRRFSRGQKERMTIHIFICKQLNYWNFIGKDGSLKRDNQAGSTRKTKFA